MARVSFVVIVAALGCIRPVVPPAPPPGASRIDAILAAFQQMGATPLWPGFEPLATPVAFYDGERTWLVRHPQPPPEFHRVRPQLAVFAGRHHAIRANTGVELAGARTATVQLSADVDPRTAAASAVHEAFHVFQQGRHPDWAANELDRFTYPDTSAEAAQLRYLEDAVLQRALEAYIAGDMNTARCTAEAALGLRAQRAAALPREAMAYEQALERAEGLSQYVEYLAFGRTPPWPDNELTPDQVRRRAYFSGQIWALLLDVFTPGWQARYDSLKPPEPLDLQLRQAITPGPACALDEKQARTARRLARRDVEALIARRSKRGRELGARSGPRLVVEAGKEPLWPRGFDPWSIEPLSGGRLLHPQWLHLGNASASIRDPRARQPDRRGREPAAGPGHPPPGGLRSGHGSQRPVGRR